MDSKGEISSSICVAACDAPGDPVLIAGDCGGVPGSTGPVLIAGDCCGVPGSSGSVSAAARRGDGSHCDDAGYERMISIRKPSKSTFISRVKSSGV